MGSVTQPLNIVRRNGELLPEKAITDLRSAVTGEVIFHGEVSEEAYLAAIDRFNKGHIQEAVSTARSSLGAVFDQISPSLYSASPRTTLLLLSNMSRTGIWTW